MNLVENDKLNVSYEIGSLVQHTPQDLGCHDKATRLGVDLNITREDAHAGGRKCGFEVAEFLIRECLYRRRVDGPS
jgi:hypothetical protein